MASASRDEHGGTPFIVDAVVLAGGRSSRLGGVAKQHLVLEGGTLLAHALHAAGFARRTVVVGDDAELGVPTVREEPPFAGPAAAVGRGLDALMTDDSGDLPPDFVLVLACDMPRVEVAVDALRRALADAAIVDGTADGVIAVDASRHRQPLVAMYRASALYGAVRQHERVERDPRVEPGATPPVPDDSLESGGRAVGSETAGLVGLSMRRLISRLNLIEVQVAPGSTDDIDTWDDARRFGISDT